MYGISSQQWKVIFSIFLRHKDLINWVKLFGSRARGDGRVTSDVDLAVSVKDGATLKHLKTAACRIHLILLTMTGNLMRI